MSAQKQTQKNPLVLLKTNLGDIQLELYADKAPKTVQNFLNYVQDGHFNHTIFHRIIDGFMIQGGGFTKDFNQKPTKAPIPNEANNGLQNKRGTVAMARTSDVNSATAQFFINVVDNSFLDFKGENPREFGYCVFGKVTDGMSTIDKIKQVDTGSHGMHQDVPLEPVEILNVSLV
jgi:cyclophilin family peptidyl-prolyl cis-trans isomerase